MKANFLFSQITILLILTACAAPKTMSEFREAAQSSSFMNKDTISLNKTNLADVKKRWQKYSEKCFNNVRTSSTSTDYSGYGPVTSTVNTAYHIEWDHTPTRESLALKADASSYNYYHFIMDAEMKNKDEVLVTMYTPKAIWGTIADTKVRDTNIIWTKGEGNPCPALK